MVFELGKLLTGTYYFHVLLFKFKITLQNAIHSIFKKNLFFVISARFRINVDFTALTNNGLSEPVLLMLLDIGVYPKNMMVVCCI